MSIQCEKCKQGQMVQDRIYRMSGCLVAIGYFLVIPGMLLMLGGIGFTFLGIGGAGAATTETFERIKKEVISDFNKASVPGQVIEEYQKTNKVSQTTINSLSPSEKEKVNRVLMSDSAKKAGAAIGTAGAAVCGGAFTMMTFIIGLPSFIIGFLLILKRNVWRCPSCNYIFDRA